MSLLLPFLYLMSERNDGRYFAGVDAGSHVCSLDQHVTWEPKVKEF